ncbi:MAG: DUF4476 domain-containing protein [Spirochaetales bacterium]|nr:DUF4476 domain-containing protein [Spirochaetales bacterium]
MKKIIIVINLLLLCHLAFSEDTSQQAALDRIINNLEMIENSYFKYLDFKERRTALKIIDEIIAMVRGDDIVIDTTSVLSDEAFDEMLKNIKNEANSNSKSSIILSIGKKGKIKCSQLKLLLETYSFDSEKVKLIKNIYPQIADPVNTVLVTATIDSSFTRDELNKWLANQ